MSGRIFSELQRETKLYLKGQKSFFYKKLVEHLVLSPENKLLGSVKCAGPKRTFFAASLCSLSERKCSSTFEPCVPSGLFTSFVPNSLVHSPRVVSSDAPGHNEYPHTHTYTQKYKHNVARRQSTSKAPSKWAHDSVKRQAKKSEFVNQPNNPTFSPGIINIKHQAKCNELSDLLAAPLRSASSLTAVREPYRRITQIISVNDLCPDRT